MGIKQEEIPGLETKSSRGTFESGPGRKVSWAGPLENVRVPLDNQSQRVFGEKASRLFQHFPTAIKAAAMEFTSVFRVQYSSD